MWGEPFAGETAPPHRVSRDRSQRSGRLGKVSCRKGEHTLNRFFSAIHPSNVHRPMKRDPILIVKEYAASGVLST